MRKLIYEEPLVEVIKAMPDDVFLATSDQTGGLEDYNNGEWNWGDDED